MFISVFFRPVFFALLCCLAAGGLRAQQLAQKFVQETHYLLYLPEGYEKDTAARWPLVLFLHGSGESGTDLQKVKAHGPPELVEKGRNFPFIVVSPQSYVPSGWDVAALHKLLLHIKQAYRVDQDRVYATGLSMGGFGTWELAMKYPGEFAAIAPVCGGGDTANAWKFRNVPVWCFHGARDEVVLPQSSRNMVNAAKKFNPSVRFTLYPEADHNSWDSAYNGNALYDWLLSHKRHRYKEVQLPLQSLKRYEGHYLGPDGDTVQIVTGDKGLLAKPGRNTVQLKAAGENLFFLQEELPLDIRFLYTGKAVSGLLFLGDRKLEYRKL
ncbi:MAG TPA: dienelactone hydrolase family protein [Flavisolibacter sp.]|nr:dienelactone hydrolase family protein [Flavisolibacter sp.]